MLFRVVRPLFLLLFAAVCASHAWAQAVAPAASQNDPRNFNATQFGDYVTLGPEWLFAVGDNPAWASPAFDDSNWKTISTEKALTGYGFRGIPFAWYRLHIHLRPGTRNLMIAIAGVNGKYEVYANGVRLGGNGKMVRSSFIAQEQLVAFGVTDSTLSASGDLTVAIRCAVNWGSSMGRGASTPLNSESVYLISQGSSQIITSYVAAHNAGPPGLLCALALLAGLIALALYFALRSQLEYLAISINLFAASFVAATLIWLNLRSFTLPVFSLEFVLLGVENFALIEFVRLVLHRPRSRWLLTLEIVSSCAFLVYPLQEMGAIAPGVGTAIFFPPILAVKIVLPVLLFRAGLKGNREASLLLPAIFVGCFADYLSFLRDVAHYAFHDTFINFLPFGFHLGSYGVDFYRVGDFIFYIAILIFLVRRTVWIARERNRAAAELEAARTTQQLLLSRCSQPTPGFHVEAIYHPASEVGGDFFEVSSMPDGSLIAIIGDVSGKGLMAAMRVAMILGVLRREDSWEPPAVLHNLNEALLTRGEAGFTTACCVQIGPGGSYTLANAGHIAPYIDGAELVTPPALPLGLAPDQHYATVRGVLAVNQKLVLLSDGVVEARSATGELLGFDRMAALTLKPAREIADTAKAFGQEDDITVLTLARTA